MLGSLSLDQPGTRDLRALCGEKGGLAAPAWEEALERSLLPSSESILVGNDEDEPGCNQRISWAQPPWIKIRGLGRKAVLIAGHGVCFFPAAMGRWPGEKWAMALCQDPLWVLSRLPPDESCRHPVRLSRRLGAATGRTKYCTLFVSEKQPLLLAVPHWRPLVSRVGQGSLARVGW